MSQKRLDENAILNELKGGSLFFQKAEESSAATELPKDVATPSVSPPESPPTLEVDALNSLPPPWSAPDAEPEKPREIHLEQEGKPAKLLASYPASMIEKYPKVRQNDWETSFISPSHPRRKRAITGSCLPFQAPRCQDHRE